LVSALAFGPLVTISTSARRCRPRWPVTAILLGYLVLGESMPARERTGAAVIGSALLLIDGRVVALVRRRLAVS
jgi:hypothetical protein